MIRNRIITTAAALSLVIGGAVVVDTATAPNAEAACTSNITIWKGKNASCSKSARHWDAIKNTTPRYGKWVTRGHYSSQTACWANVVSYGMTVA
ncbi:hypothetical protein ACPEEZ_04720 [Frigoribacterium sp. 2-23]|uniref:hypothetical protein n=1 Tax=Frigoribacterium sp. 2-23 TaxID=3415006 RepID=UPI003C6F8196